MKKRIPPRPDLGHLKKQAKALLSAYRAGDPAACARLCDTLPAARGRPVAAIARLDLRLHDAQSCIAREYGLASWTELKDFVLARQAQSADPAAAALQWLRFVYAGDIAGGTNRAKPSVAAQLLEDNPVLRGADPWLACAVGDETLLRRTIERDRAWAHRPGGPLQLPPLVAVTHSSLLRLPAFRDGLRACARQLLAAGADPNQSVGNRWPPASVAAPDEAERLSALYGAAGQNHDAELTKLLLDAGADPNDGESLYHSLENIACTRALLEAGARVVGTNALHRVLDLDRLESLQLLLSHGADPNEPIDNPAATDWHTPLLWAIRRRRSTAHIEALLAAGADPSVATPGGVNAALLAQRFGLPEIASLLRRAGGSPASSLAEEFIAACARGDEAAAQALHSAHPGLIGTLSESQLKLLPELAAEGCGEAVRLMVRLGWPVATRGGDLNGSALNQAVFRGDASLARFLLEHGASWREAHGYGDNVIGSLSWASLNEPVEGGDWLGCAEALAGHGMPLAQPDPQDSTSVLIDGRRKWFSDEVSDYLLGIG
ncbi:ankyrin repeat domain-containing protein [Xenophilus arseniciresistens]|uniref:Ankyrin repeat domain-containing protein n=1 Tax=Xenophilus arseniciresistens TaxID=1283306 RepID=A0AAE3N330_9BURK|nr:ankyrin repeat domain-containing protein [Xenophilus arseniciresistens]MDA7414870.1 ankyrin repeat domain-containing protein [Xenophilus arseniciresistens]